MFNIIPADNTWDNETYPDDVISHSWPLYGNVHIGFSRVNGHLLAAGHRLVHTKGPKAKSAQVYGAAVVGGVQADELAVHQPYCGKKSSTDTSATTGVGPKSSKATDNPCPSGAIVVDSLDDLRLGDLVIVSPNTDLEESGRVTQILALTSTNQIAIVISPAPKNVHPQGAIVEIDIPAGDLELRRGTAASTSPSDCTPGELSVASSDSSPGTSAGAMIGLGMGVALVVLVFAMLAIYYFAMKNAQHERREESTEDLESTSLESVESASDLTAGSSS
jgi:hypothetical protein